LRPFFWIAANCAPWVDDGDILARAQFGRQQAAMAPAPTTQIFFCWAVRRADMARQHLVENIAEAADTIDHDIDDVVASPMVPAPSEVPTAMMSPGISVTSLKCGDGLCGGKTCRARVVLSLFAVGCLGDDSFIGSTPVAITGPNTPKKVSKLLARAHCSNRLVLAQGDQRQ